MTTSPHTGTAAPSDPRPYVISDANVPARLIVPRFFPSKRKGSARLSLVHSADHPTRNDQAFFASPLSRSYWWFTAVTKAQHEKALAEELSRAPAELGVGYYLPYNHVRYANRTTGIIPRFPRYLFVCVAPASRSIRAGNAKSPDSIARFEAVSKVKSSRHSFGQVLMTELQDRFRAELSLLTSDEVQPETIALKNGARVKILDPHPSAGLTGVIAGTEKDGRIRVAFDATILGGYVLSVPIPVSELSVC